MMMVCSYGVYVGRRVNERINESTTLMAKIVKLTRNVARRWKCEIRGHPGIFSEKKDRIVSHEYVNPALPTAPQP